MPRALPCPSCGQMFLPSGLRFHLKVCQPRQGAMIVSCPYCQMEMPQQALSGHTAVCKAARRAQDMRRSGNFDSGDAHSSGRFVAESLSDGRSRCQFCGRVFTESRIHQHRAICGSLRQARPAGIGGVRTQLPKRVYNAAAARMTLPGSFDRQRKHLFIPREAAENKGVLVRCAGVARKIGSKAAATLAPWTVLGVRRHASIAEVKAAYHKLAKEWHPDRHPEQGKAEAEARFKAIGEAHEAMTKPRHAARAGRRRPLALVSPDSWRAKHDEFVSAARAGRGGARGARPPRQPLQGGGSLDGRVLCPHCGRRFGQVQAERHIPKCSSIVNKPRPPPLRAAESMHLPQAAQRERPESPVLSAGAAVLIHGLANAPHLNGTTGCLQSFDSQACRWHVELQGGRDVVAVKAINLRVQNSATMKGSRLSSTCPPMGRSGHGRGRGAPSGFPRQPAADRPESHASSSSSASASHSAVGVQSPRHNGRTVDWSEAIPRQHARPQNGRPLDRAEGNSSHPTNLSLGAEVRLQGLVAASHLNGLLGVLRHFDHEASRWHVELPGGETKAVRAEHLASPCTTRGSGRDAHRDASPARISRVSGEMRANSTLRREHSSGSLPPPGRGPGKTYKR